jgi:hypothetical protein
VRKVDRKAEAVPAALSKANKEGKTELDRAREHAADSDPKKGAFPFAAYKDDEVKRALEALFHGKCAYCETFFANSAPVDVEHYRPKGRVAEDTSHPGYWWLAMDWHNLLPSCIDCNRRRGQIVVGQGSSLQDLLRTSRTRTGHPTSQSGKQDSFPIAGARIPAESTNYAAEAALLLDPCRDDPETDLVFHIDHNNPLGLVLPTGGPATPSPRGTTSIHTYGLNRLRLVQERTRLLRRLEFLGNIAVELSDMAAEIADPAVKDALPQGRSDAIVQRLRFLADRTLAEMRSMAEPTEPFSALARQWLREFSSTISSPPPP